MGHILCAEKDFVFIHIPKNGGSTVHNQFCGFDDTGGKFFYTDDPHPVLGDVAIGHLPLWAIEKYYADEFTKISNTWGGAITRDPEARFRSALAQRVRQFMGRTIETLTIDERQQEVGKVLRHLEVHDELPHRDFCHFTRQVDFVQIAGNQIINNVFPIEGIDVLLAELSQRAGIKATSRASNKTEFTRHGLLGQAARMGWSFVKPVLPANLQNAARKKFRSSFVQTSMTKDDLGIMDDSVVRFVRDFYAKDYDLHQTALIGAASAKQKYA